MYTGYTPTYPEHLRKANEVASILTFLKENPGNRYWTRRLIACAPAPLPSDGRQWDEPSAEEVETFWGAKNHDPTPEELAALNEENIWIEMMTQAHAVENQPAIYKMVGVNTNS